MSIDQETDAMIEMWQFRLSMYPEKVRWALDYKGIPHILHSLMPGPHAVPMLLRARQKALPVMTHGAAMIKGSATIIDYLEQHFPEKSLYPADPILRDQALALQHWFDEVGLHIRCAFFHEFLPETAYAANLFSIGYPPRVRQLYRIAFPVTRSIMQQDMGISRKTALEGYRRTEEALDFLVQQLGSAKYLVGGQFSIADLAAAVILFPTVFPPQYPVAFPYPRPAPVEQWLLRWAGHPATTWVREIYRVHRGQSAAIEDQNG